jgi:hypothetical protein
MLGQYMPYALNIESLPWLVRLTVIFVISMVGMYFAFSSFKIDEMDGEHTGGSKLLTTASVTASGLSYELLIEGQAM